MSIHADDVQTFHVYAQGVMTRTAHHAANVTAIALALLGGIIWRAVPGTIEIKQYDGSLANIVWWISAATGRRYACAYNHQTQEIEIRDRTTQGTVLYHFSNATPIATVEHVFCAL